MNATAFLRLSIGAFALALSCSAVGENAVTSRYTTVRAGPDRSYPVIAELGADTPVEVIGCLDDWSWCDVGFGGDRGWLYAPELTYEYEGGYVPLYSYAPGLGIPVVGFALDSYWPRYYHDRPFYRERDEWERRGPPQHERPPGPGPSSGPPPREALASRPGRDSQRGRSVRLGSAEPNNRSVERDDRGRNQAGDNGTVRGPEPRSGERPPTAAPRAEPSRAETPRAESRSRPAERSVPPRNEEQARPAPQRAAPRREEHPAEPPPRKDEKSDHPPG